VNPTLEVHQRIKKELKLDLELEITTENEIETWKKRIHASTLL